MSGQLRYDWNMGFYESINYDALVKSPRQTTFTLLVVYTLESETLYVAYQS
jgi:hypothetical protein